MNSKRILISGTTGLVGKALVNSLENSGADVWKLMRNSTGATNEILWDPLLPVAADNVGRFEGFDAVVHLAGEPIFGRWTAEKKRRIRDSRVLGTHNLCVA